MNLMIELENLRKKFDYISKEKNIIKDKYEQLTKDMDKDKKTVDDLKNSIKEKDDIISNLEDKNKAFLNVIKEYNGMKNALKLSLNFDIKGEEKLMCLDFVSTNSIVHHAIICKNTQKFNEVENLLYEKYPQYKETNNVFLSNGVIINKSKTLSENGIRDGEIITMTFFEDED